MTATIVLGNAAVVIHEIEGALHRRKTVVLDGNMKTKGINSENAGIAATGMFLAAAELCREGFDVTPTSRNMAGADLLITDDRCHNTWTIQVKVTDRTHKRRRGWLIGRNAALTAHPTHAYVFVMLNGDNRPDFYVVPSEFVATHQSGAPLMPEFSQKGCGVVPRRLEDTATRELAALSDAATFSRAYSSASKSGGGVASVSGRTADVSAGLASLGA